MMGFGSIIIPTIGKESMILDLLNDISIINDPIIEKIFIMDNGMPDSIYQLCASFDKVEIISANNLGIYEMWNLGLTSAKKSSYAFILNDDLRLDTNNCIWFTMLISPMLIDDNIWASCPNYNLDKHSSISLGYKEVTGTYKDNGFSGFCFAVNIDAYNNGLSLFDENYYWWFGDDDFVHSIHKNGKKTVLVTDVYVNHINGGSQTVVQYTPEFNDKVDKDRIYYLEKWHNG